MSRARPRSVAPRAALLAAGALALAALLAACGDDGGGEVTSIGTRVEQVDPDPRFEVTASEVEPVEGDDASFAHEVRVRWSGEEPVVLDDARFTLDAAGEDDGHLVLAGRGCGAEWSEEREQVDWICTADLQVIEVAPGEEHAYPVRVYAELDPLRLEPGTYEVETAIPWWFASDEPYETPGTAPEGELRLRLTYEAE